MIVREQIPPLRVLRGFRDEQGSVVVHLQNISGGVLGGDQLFSRFDVGAGCSVLLTTTAATKIYRTAEKKQEAYSRTIVHVGSNALLEYTPDSLIPFAGSRYVQETAITLDSGAGLIWWELVAPGREARGEVFQYDRLEWTFELTANDVLIAAERVLIEPAIGPLNSKARLGAYHYLAAIYVCREGIAGERWRELEEQLAGLVDHLGRNSNSFWGVSALSAHGLKISGLAMRGREAMSALQQFWMCAKMALYGKPALPPRKIY